MRIIQLQKIVSDRARDFHTDTDDLDENASQNGRAVVTAPVSVNVDAIRCFYPRKDARPGTRITFTDGGGFAVTDLYDEVSALVG